MKYLISFLIYLTLLVFLAGCQTISAYYDIKLKKVERPAQARERYGEQIITEFDEEGVNKYFFEDEMVNIVWIPTAQLISFILTNKTDHSIKIIWDEAAYVDENGVSHRVMHSGTKLIDRDNSQPNSVVVRNGTITDIIFPTENVYYIGGQYGGWRELPLFPTSWDSYHNAQDAEEWKNNAKKCIGKTIEILLPLQIEEILNDYIFTFEIENVEVK